MPPARVVPALDVVEHREAGGGVGVEPLAIEQLTFERREEAFAQGVVVRIAHRSHRRPDTRLLAALAEGDGRVLPKFNWSE